MSASRKSDEKKFTVVWLNDCVVEEAKRFESPTFTLLDKTRWRLTLLYEMGLPAGGRFVPHLVRKPDFFRQKTVPLNYELLIGFEGKLLYKGQGEHTFGKGRTGDFVTLHESSLIFAETTRNRQEKRITICCRMWKKDGELPESGQCLIKSGNVIYDIDSEEISKLLNIAFCENQLSDSIPKVIHTSSSSPRTLQMDLEQLYKNQFMCDKKLRTRTTVFPVHSLILSARSPVFERMFGSDMKEKSSDRVDIDDLEDDTVRRMLLFLYSDKVEELKMESAKKLYYAADKYEIELLKSACVSYLTANVSISNVCEVLLLADLHQEENLKSAASKFVQDHYKEVMLTEQWSSFMIDHIQIAAEIMHRHALQ